jgi:flagellar hook-basal body protein
MIRGFYTALSGVLSTMSRQAVVADNIANTSTVGFKESRTVQDDFELQIMNSLGPELGQLGTGAMPTGLKLDTSQGPLESTGNLTDLAVDGDGLFSVRTPSGVA